MKDKRNYHSAVDKPLNWNNFIPSLMADREADEIQVISKLLKSATDLVIRLSTAFDKQTTLLQQYQYGFFG